MEQAPQDQGMQDQAVSGENEGGPDTEVNVTQNNEGTPEAPEAPAAPAEGTEGGEGDGSGDSAE